MASHEVLDPASDDPMPIDSDVEADVDQLYSEPEGDDDTAPQNGAGPSGRIPGQSLLPMVRLENIIQADGVTGSLTMSKEALFIISVATEEFIKRMAQGGLDQAKSQDRYAVQYDDMAATILQYQEFRFLEDFVPTPISLEAALQERENMEAKVFDEEPAPPPRPSNTVPSAASAVNPSSTSKFRVTSAANARASASSAPHGPPPTQSTMSAYPTPTPPAASNGAWNHAGANATSYWARDQPLDSLKQYITTRFPDIPADTPTPELLEILARRGIIPRIDPIYSGPPVPHAAGTPAPSGVNTPAVETPPVPTPTTADSLSQQTEDVKMEDVETTSEAPSRNPSLPLTDSKMEEP